MRDYKDIDLSDLPKYPIINNVEFIVFYISKYGPSSFGNIRNALAKWRFNKDRLGRGHYCIYFAHEHTYANGRCGKAIESSTFWYREDYRKPYHLTYRGVARSAEVLEKVNSYMDYVMSGKKRIPEKYYDTIKAVVEENPMSPRYQLARALRKKIESISHNTAMEYIFYAPVEGIVKRKGTLYYL